MKCMPYGHENKSMKISIASIIFHSIAENVCFVSISKILMINFVDFISGA